MTFWKVIFLSREFLKQPCSALILMTMNDYEMPVVASQLISQAHYAGWILKCRFISSVRPTVYTNLLRKRKFWNWTPIRLEEFEIASFTVFIRKQRPHNANVISLPEILSNTNPKWSAMLRFETEELSTCLPKIRLHIFRFMEFSFYEWTWTNLQSRLNLRNSFTLLTSSSLWLVYIKFVCDPRGHQAGACLGFAHFLHM